MTEWLCGSFCNGEIVTTTSEEVLENNRRISENYLRLDHPINLTELLILVSGIYLQNEA